MGESKAGLLAGHQWPSWGSQSKVTEGDRWPHHRRRTWESLADRRGKACSQRQAQKALRTKSFVASFYQSDLYNITG